MKKRDFEAMLWQLVQAFWANDSLSYERYLDHLALECTDDQWQVVDDTCGLLEDPDGYIVAEVGIETPTSPFAVISEA